MLKDALFVLNRYSELEKILEEMYEKYPNNIEILASLADYYSHKGEIDKAISIVNTKNNIEKSSLLIDLIKIKLELLKNNNNDLVKDLDHSINNLVKNMRYQFSNKSKESDMMWLLDDKNN